MNWIKRTWCDLFHKGGIITRNDKGEINWRCATCGRWGVPVPTAEERKVVDRSIAAHRSKPAKPKAGNGS